MVYVGVVLITPPLLLQEVVLRWQQKTVDNLD